MIARTTTYLKTSPKGTVFQVTRTFIVNEKADVQTRRRSKDRKASNLASNVRYVESHTENEPLDLRELKSIMEAYEEYQQALKY